MKKIFFPLITLCSLLLTGCEPPVSPVITITPADVTIYVGETDTLTATITPATPDAHILWTSAASDIVSVDENGIITAYAPGKTTITAAAQGCQSATCIVTVKDIPTPEPEPEPEPKPTFTKVFPRTFLMEHFTTAQCGACPNGMNALRRFFENTTQPYVWISHHAGFGTDEYTIPANTQMARLLGVNSAPSVVHNRTLQSKGYNFNPGYLPSMTFSDDTLAEASIIIRHTFNASTNQLDITVNGQVEVDIDTKLLLTVLIKESGLVGKQADFVYAWQQEGWKEYMHVRAVRDVITHHFGDTVDVTNKEYTHTLSYTVDPEWVPENCCIVAYLTPIAKAPIINAHQTPLVEGTLGGEDFIPYGITDFNSPFRIVNFDQVQVEKIEDEDLMLVTLISADTLSTAYGPANPVAMIYLNTDADTLQPGTYPIQDDDAPNTIIGGYRIDEKASFSGSLFVYAVNQYLAQGIIAAAHIWRMRSGEMVVDQQGAITLEFKTCSGATIVANYKPSASSAPARYNLRPSNTIHRYSTLFTAVK